MRTPTSFRLDPDVKAKVLNLLENPVNRRTRWGSLSDLVNYLLLQWVADQIKAREKGTASND
jgi:hypothetical protein